MSVDKSKLAFTSGFRYEQVLPPGSIPFHMASTDFSTTVVIPHNLGYAPFCRLFYGFNDGRIFEVFAGSNSFNIDGNGAQIENVTIDTANVTVIIDNFSFPAAAINGRVYYRIYQEQIA